jgi:hypothetical protein
MGQVMEQRADLRQPPIFMDAPDPVPNASACSFSSFVGGKGGAGEGPVDFYGGDGDRPDPEEDEEEDASESESDQEGRDSHEEYANAPPPPPPRPPSARQKPRTERAVESYADLGHADGRAYAMDMGMYIVSGIILIFLMEQFIQLGARLR